LSLELKGRLRAAFFLPRGGRPAGITLVAKSSSGFALLRKRSQGDTRRPPSDAHLSVRIPACFGEGKFIEFGSKVGRQSRVHAHAVDMRL